MSLMTDCDGRIYLIDHHGDHDFASEEDSYIQLYELVNDEGTTTPHLRQVIARLNPLIAYSDCGFPCFSGTSFRWGGGFYIDLLGNLVGSCCAGVSLRKGGVVSSRASTRSLDATASLARVHA